AFWSGYRRKLRTGQACRGLNGKAAIERIYLFENWNERRAFAFPYFLRSTTRGSRVRNPPRFNAPRRSGSKFSKALERPWRTAPACPDNPPPDTVQVTSYCPPRLVATNGC